MRRPGCRVRARAFAQNFDEHALTARRSALALPPRSRVVLAQRRAGLAREFGISIAFTRRSYPQKIPRTFNIRETVMATKFVDMQVLEQQCLADWKRDKALREEFCDDYDAFKSFRIADARGVVRILGEPHREQRK